MKKLLAILIFALLSLPALGQASWYGSVAQGGAYINGIQVEQPLGGASLLVCTTVATCDLSHLATIYTTSAATVTVDQTNFPVVADNQGNFGFWALPGTYQYSFTYKGATYGPYTVTIGPDLTKPVSAKNIEGVRYADQFATVHAAINDFGAPGACGIVYIPQGTYTDNITINTSNTCTNPSNQVTIRGAGMRNTILKPAANACVLTIDSTAGPVQHVVVEDLGFDNTGTGFTGVNNNAICIIGNGINDEHTFRRVYATGGFYHNVNITGRCIWCTFENDEFTNAANDSFSVTTATTALVGALQIINTKIDTATGRCLYMNPGGTAVYDGVHILDSTFQNCTQEGANLSNIDALDINVSDFEANGSSGTYDNVLLAGTYMRGFHIHANHFLGSTTGSSVHISATQSSGTIDGNFLNAAASNPTVKVDSSVAALSQITIGSNWEATSAANPHSIAADANTTYHVNNHGSQLSLPPTSNSQTGSVAISVQGISSIRFSNTAPLTVTNFTNADPGQMVHVYNEGSSTVTFTYGVAAFFTPSGTNLTLNAGESVLWVFAPVNSRWLYADNSPLYTRALTVGAGGAAINGNATIAGLISSYNGVTTVGSGVPYQTGRTDLTAQAANITAQTLYTPAATGLYRVSVSIIVTQAATTSSTLPSVVLAWTDGDNSTVQSFTMTATNAGNTLTTYATGTAIINAKLSTAISWTSTGYLSSGATPMQYAVHVRAEAL